MRIWYDACTGKHVRYGAAIAQRLRKSGHDFVFTTREHPDTVVLARILGENPIILGKYEPSSLFSRLEESADRVLKFSHMFRENMPNVAISHQSVELCRTAFGLGMPIILTADTPYASAVNRLTIPFANTLIVSECIPLHFLRANCAKNVVRFKGVDEVAWIKDFKPSKQVSWKRPLIVVRQTETKAAYAAGKKDLTEGVLEELSSLCEVFYVNRYNSSELDYRAKQGFIDTASLVASADLVVSPGGTLAREAALQGVPSIVISELGKTYVNEYVAHRGFPLYITTPRKLVHFAKKLLGKRFNVQDQLSRMENPVDYIEAVLTKTKTE